MTREVLYMKCHEVESIATDLARGQIMDATVQARALGHARECGRCGAYLENQRALGAGLRALAQTDAAVDAPARLEAALLKAYREQHCEKPVASATLASAAESHGSKAWMRWAVAAAVIILIAGFALMRRQEAPAPPEQARQVQRDQERQPEQEKTVAKEVVQSPQPEAMRKQVVARGNASSGVNSRNRPRSAQRALPATRDAEVTTPFIALTSESDLMSLDRGQVVRVKLPRTALESFGLPMNQARAGEPVKADVLIGEDGLARAIRFVR